MKTKIKFPNTPYTEIELKLLTIKTEKWSADNQCVHNWIRTHAHIFDATYGSLNAEAETEQKKIRLWNIIRFMFSFFPRSGLFFLFLIKFELQNLLGKYAMQCNSSSLRGEIKAE